MSGAPAAAPPAEGGATLQGQLRALSARVLARARHDAGVSSSAELSSDAPSETSRAVGRLQRRALEVLLRFDEDVPVADLDPAERAERNALRLGAAALSMRARGARADADRLERLHDAFVTRRTAVLRASASAPTIEPLEEHAATLALLLSLANTGGDFGAAGCVRARRVTSDVSETKMSARAARAAAWLRLDSTIRFDVVDATRFGAGPASDDDFFDDDAREARTKDTGGGGGGSARFKPLARLDAAPAPLRLGATRRPNDENENVVPSLFADGTFPTRSDGREDPHDPSRSLFGALRRARVPAAFDERDALAIRVAIRDEPALASVARGGEFECGDFACEPAPEGTREATFAAESKRRASVAEEKRKRNADAEPASERTPETAREEDDPWLAAAAAGAGPNRRTSSATEVFGWDEADAEKKEEKGTRRQRHAPACDAFLAGGEAAFGDAYGTFVRPAARLFGAATPARATQEELVQATRRALAGQRAAAHALVPQALAHDAPRGARDPPPLRLPAASAGSVAGALRALADAAEDRAALDAFVRRAEAESRGEEFTDSPRMDLAARAAASAARDVLRAHDAALLALPAAAAARRAAERAADEVCDPRERTAAAYRVEPNETFLNDDCDSPRAGVTLLEARAHTRALRAQLAAMRLLCAPANEEVVSHSSTLRRALGALAAGGARDAGERNLLRRLAAAAAAPALAQARVWTRRAAVADDPRGEFFVRVSEGWGASANELALSPAEASVEAWRVRALERALEPDSDADEREELLFFSKVESDAGDASDADRLELAELPPWRGGPPGRARELAGGAPPEERASLRDDFSRSGTHLLFAGAERDALALGVHLRILQRLPQTASFAAAVASLDETLEDEALSSATKKSGVAWRPWTLAFDAEALAEATSRGRRTSLALRALARRTLDAMASTRDAETARAEARRRARNAAETARRLEKDAATAAAKETLLEDFARRMASLAARRAREAYARRALRASGRESLLSALEEPLPEGEGEKKARRKKEDENDEASIRAALEEALDVARRVATPGSATHETPPRDAAAEGSAPSPSPSPSPASASRRDAPSPSPPTSPIGSSPDAYFRDLRRSRDGGGTHGSPLDVSADDLEASFRTARSSGELNTSLPGSSLDEVALAPSTPAPSGFPIPIAVAEGERLVPASRAESVEKENAREGIYPDSLDASAESEKDSREGDFSDGAAETRKSRDAEPERESEPEPEPEPERDPVLEIPLAALVDRCVSGPIRDARAVVASLVARTFLEHLGLETHCASMRAFLLCGAGDFASALAERVADAAARARVAGACQGAAPAAFLRDALESARLQSSACDEPLARRWRLRSRAPPKANEASRSVSYSASYSGVRDAAFSEHSAGMVDFLEASYELEWPLGALFPSATRTTLAEAHRQLLRLRHVSLALAEAHARVHEAGRAYRGSLRSRARDDDEDAFGGVAGRLLADRRLRRLSLLSHELRHFVAAVEASAGEECHGAARAALEKAFFEDADGRNRKKRTVRARDAYALRAAAAAYATRCASACFLSARDAPLREAVDVALQLALDFRKATRAAATETRAASASSLLTDGSTYASVQATHARFRVAARRLCVCLRDATADRGGALGGVEPRRAAELLERIDHNGFYLRSAE